MKNRREFLKFGALVLPTVATSSVAYSFLWPKYAFNPSWVKFSRAVDETNGLRYLTASIDAAFTPDGNRKALRTCLEDDRGPSGFALCSEQDLIRALRYQHDVRYCGAMPYRSM